VPKPITEIGEPSPVNSRLAGFQFVGNVPRRFADPFQKSFDRRK
jgi:hypothetical protein